MRNTGNGLGLNSSASMSIGFSPCGGYPCFSSTFGFPWTFVITVVLNMMNSGWNIYQSYKVMKDQYPETTPKTPEDAEKLAKVYKQAYPSIPMDQILKMMMSDVTPSSPTPTTTPTTTTTPKEGMPSWGWALIAGVGALVLLKGKVF